MPAGKSSYPEAKLLVSAECLAGRIDDPDVRVVDVRPPIPQLRIGYPWGHIPGAVYLDLGVVFSGRASGVSGTLGPTAEVTAMLNYLGLSEDITVFIYDSHGGPAAAQAFWLLEIFGYSDVRLLEGGFAAWRLAGLPFSAQEPAVKRVEVNEGRLADKRIATLNWLLDRLDGPELVLVDTRTPGEYAAGHLPGAVLLPWEENLEEVGQTTRFRDAAELHTLFEAAGVTRDRTVVTYCQTGARSAHTYFTLRLLGYPEVRNYDGSWQEWSAIPETPKER